MGVIMLPSRRPGMYDKQGPYTFLYADRTMAEARLCEIPRFQSALAEIIALLVDEK